MWYLHVPSLFYIAVKTEVNTRSPVQSLYCSHSSNPLLRQCILNRFVNVCLDTSFHLHSFRVIPACYLESLLKIGTDRLHKLSRLGSEVFGYLITLHTSMEKSSKGAPSTTLIVNLLLGCTVANPLDTRTVFTNMSVKRGRGKDCEAKTNQKIFVCLWSPRLLRHQDEEIQ